MMRRLGSLLIAAAVLALAVAPAANAQDDTPEPILEANLEGAGFGEVVVVSGTNWPQNSIAQVEVCGNLGLNGTRDCDQITAVQAGVSTVGSFGAVMLVGNPPVPCPCVFRATSLTSGLVQTLEFELRGAAVSSDDPAAIALPERRLDITEARIDGSGPWTSLFGARPDRTLTLTIVNTGFVVVNNPSLVLGLGKGANPAGFVRPPEIDPLEPGDSITVSVDLDLPVFAIGTYGVEGAIPGFAVPVEFRAETSHVPWLLVLIPLLILALVAIIVIRNRVRNRANKDDEIYVASSGAVVPVPAASSDQEIDDLAVVDLREEEPIDVDAVWDDAELADGFDSIIDEELGAVFESASRLREESSGDDDFRTMVNDLAMSASDRVAGRAGLGDTERNALGDELTHVILASFGADNDQPSDNGHHFE